MRKKNISKLVATILVATAMSIIKKRAVHFTLTNLLTIIFLGFGLCICMCCYRWSASQI